MGTQVFALMLFVAAPVAGDSDRDVAKLLASIRSITADRWNLSFDANTNAIELVSKEQITARVMGYSHSPFERTYRIRYRYKVVPQVDEANIGQIRRHLQRELANLQKAARFVPHEEVKAHVTYHPRTAMEWGLVLRVKRAEARLNKLPQYAFKGIYLSLECGMPFQPREGDVIGEAMANDVKAVYALLRPLESALSPIPADEPKR